MTGDRAQQTAAQDPGPGHLLLPGPRAPCLNSRAYPLGPTFSAWLPPPGMPSTRQTLTRSWLSAWVVTTRQLPHGTSMCTGPGPPSFAHINSYSYGVGSRIICILGVRKRWQREVCWLGSAHPTCKWQDLPLNEAAWHTPPPTVRDPVLPSGALAGETGGCSPEGQSGLVTAGEEASHPHLGP